MTVGVSGSPILGVARALRIAELPAIVGLMVDALRRPGRRDRRKPGGAPAARRPPPRPAADPAAWDAFVERAIRGTYLQLDAWAAVKAVNGWAAPARDGPDRGRCGTTDGAQVLAAPAAAVPWASRTPRAARSAAGGRPGDDRGASPTRSGASCARAGRVSQVRIDPEIERDGPLDPDGALRGALATRRLAPGAADPAGRDPGHRPACGRGGPVGRPAQEVAPVREQGPLGRRHGRGRRRATGSASSTRSTARRRDRAGFLIRTEAAYRDVWDAFRPTGRARLLFA